MQYFYIYSASSRILEITFSKPTRGPKCAAEMEVYQGLAEDLNNDTYSKSVGFIIKLASCLRGDGSKRVKEIQKDLQFSHSLMERNVCAWSILLFFLEKVCYSCGQYTCISVGILQILEEVDRQRLETLELDEETLPVRSDICVLQNIII